MANIELTIQDVTKKYKDITALDHFSIALSPGIYGLLGPNGAGKSTLMRCIADIIHPDSGEIAFNGKNIYTMGAAFRNVLGFLPQEVGFYPSFTGEQIIKYFAGLKGIKVGADDIEKYLKDVNLLEFKKKKVGGYSGGMKRRLGIAVTFLNNPDVMIFDEPTAGLDPEERVRFRNLLQELGKTKIIILATHIISDLESVCDKIFFIKKGSLIKTVDNLEDEAEPISIEQLYLDLFGQNAVETK